MVFILPTDHGEMILADEVFERVLDHAKQMAALAAVSLESLLDVPHATALPAAFLLELAAVVQLCLWQERWPTSAWPQGIPTYSEAARDLAERSHGGAHAFAELEAATLSIRLLAFSIDRIAWDAPGTMQGAFLIAETDDNAFVEAMARFLSQNRHLLEELAEKGLS